MLKNTTALGITLGSLLIALPGIAAAEWEHEDESIYDPGIAPAPDTTGGGDAYDPTGGVAGGAYDDGTYAPALPDAPYVVESNPAEAFFPAEPPLHVPMSGDPAAGGKETQAPLPPAMYPPLDRYPGDHADASGSCPKGLATPGSMRLPFADELDDAGINPYASLPQIEAYCGGGASVWVGDGSMGASVSAYGGVWLPAMATARTLKAVFGYANVLVERDGYSVHADLLFDGNSNLGWHRPQTDKLQDSQGWAWIATDDLRLAVPLPFDFAAAIGFKYEALVGTGAAYELGPLRARATVDAVFDVFGEVYASVWTPRICFAGIDWDFVCWGGEESRKDGRFTFIDDTLVASATVEYRHKPDGVAVCGDVVVQNTLARALEGGIPGLVQFEDTLATLGLKTPDQATSRDDFCTPGVRMF